MPLEEEITLFIDWATNFGFSLEDLPSRDALKSVFKSPQRELFCNLIERVKPLQQCKTYRDNILIEKMDKMLNQVDTVCNRKCLPKQMQHYIRIEELKKTKSDFETKTNECRSEYKKLSASINFKNIQKIKIKNNYEQLKTKINIFKLKNNQLIKKLEEEEVIKKKIIAGMPVRIAKNVDGNDFIADALKELDNFYNIFLNNSNSQVVQYAKDNLWKKIRKTFSDIPDYLIFEEIVRLKEEQLHDISALNKSNREDSNKSTIKETLKPFELHIIKSKTALLGIIAKYAAALQEDKDLEEKFELSYNKFVEIVQSKINLFDEDIETTLDFICQFSTRNFNKGQNDYFVKEIEKLQTENEEDLNKLKNHTILLDSINDIYSEIDTSINRIQYEMIQLNQIKEKIVYSKQLLQYMLSEVRNDKHKFLSTTSKIHKSGTDSFEMTTENFFSSTKVDFDITLNSTITKTCDTTVMPQIRNALPSYVHEMQTFIETPIERFDCVPLECAFYISSNPLITESKELSSSLQLAPGILLTPFGAIQEINSLSEWFIKLMKMSNHINFNCELPQADRESFKKMIKQQNDDITELLDQIHVTGINTKRILEKASKYYNFYLSNPLRNYVPPTKLFNNQSYSDYESEFMMYYRMATNNTK